MDDDTHVEMNRYSQHQNVPFFFFFFLPHQSMFFPGRMCKMTNAEYMVCRNNLSNVYHLSGLCAFCFATWKLNVETR